MAAFEVTTEVGIKVAFVLAQILLWIFFGLMRYSLRVISRAESAIAIVGLMMMNLGPLVFFIHLRNSGLHLSVLPGEIGIHILLLISLLVLLNDFLSIAFVFAGSLFVLLATTMLLHRAFWPAIDRPLYKLQALGISKRPKIFATVGVLLVGIGFGKPEWLKVLVDKVF